MRSLRSRIPAIAMLTLLLCGAGPMSAQSGSQTDSAVIGQCVRWLKAIVPDQAQDRLNAANFCRGYSTGNVDGLWSDCRPPQASGRPAGHCGFMGRVMHGDTLALSVITPSQDGREFLNAGEQASSDQRGVVAVLYSRTDFVIDGTRLRVGLYRILPRKPGENWEMDFYRIDGAWNDPVSPSQPVFRAALKSNEDANQSEKLVSNMWLVAKHCGATSGVSSLREFEFGFGETDVSLCVNVSQATPPVHDQVSQR